MVELYIITYKPILSLIITSTCCIFYLLLNMYTCSCLILGVLSHTFYSKVEEHIFVKNAAMLLRGNYITIFSQSFCATQNASFVASHKYEIAKISGKLQVMYHFIQFINGGLCQPHVSFASDITRTQQQKSLKKRTNSHVSHGPLSKRGRAMNPYIFLNPYILLFTFLHCNLVDGQMNAGGLLEQHVTLEFRWNVLMKHQLNIEDLYFNHVFILQILSEIILNLSPFLMCLYNKQDVMVNSFLI
ncbi:hypothetical protein ACJX0J_017946 [Zea mays]